jgi:hypothetical protein
LPTAGVLAKNSAGAPEREQIMKNIIVAGLLAAFVSWGPAWAADSIGNVVAVVGAPSASGPAGDRSLKKGSDVFVDDVIRVSKGNAQILLKDGTRLVVGPGSTLLLDQFVMRGEKKADKVAIQALRGTYRFITGRSAKEAYKITTSSATIGIRGTGFDFWVKNKTGVVVLKGSVNLDGLQSGRVRVDSGCEMGEATTNAARELKGTEKRKTINDNLPFILNQSQLTPRFRLNVNACNLGAPEEQRSGQPEQKRERREENPTPNNPPPDRTPTDSPNQIR